LSTVYWDDMLFAYLIERHPDYGLRVERILGGMRSRKDMLCTSIFTVGEVLTKPYRDDDQDMIGWVHETLSPPSVELLPFNLETADRYARIRAASRVSPPDAIHLATAAQRGVNLFLTHDRDLRKLIIPGIDFIAGLDVNLF